MLYFLLLDNLVPFIQYMQFNLLLLVTCQFSRKGTMTFTS